MIFRSLNRILLLGAAVLSLASCARLGRVEQPTMPADYYDKVRGAWLGKCVGGALGMPIEGWSSEQIRKKYGTVTDYIGYFDEIVMKTSDPIGEVPAPVGAEWTTVTLEATVPDYDQTKFHACPAVGFLTTGESKLDGKAELRDLHIEGGPDFPAIAPEVWAGYFVGVGADGVAAFDYKGYFGSQWLKLMPAITKRYSLKPGSKLKFTFSARVLSGSYRLAACFDYIHNGPRPGFGPDDDTCYQIVSLLALEKYGPDLSSKQIGKQWTESLGFVSPLLAEGISLQKLRDGIDPPESGNHKMNEAIGGQIKAEIWGLVCPGQPALAAEYARRDGVVAHWRNGVYGEQFVAAMMAAAFKEKDPAKLIEIGLQYIPADSLYAQTVRSVVEDHKAGKDYREILSGLVKKYPTPCDPLYGDGGIITLALLYGQGDFEKTILIAAACGQDTDCDTATVGALVGCMRGGSTLPAKWTTLIGDEFRCDVKDHHVWSINELAQRICASGERVMQYHAQGKGFSTDL